MKRVSSTLVACSLAISSAAWAQTTTTTTVTTTTATPATTSSATTSYISRVTPRFESFAGSQDNLASLAGGLRTGGVITLTGNGETVAFNSPTKPMGYGNITRAMDLAQRQLAAQGITDPTPSQLQTALMGGTITTAKGTVTYTGVLQMRADGMGWGQIAHAIGVHPGMGKSSAAAASTSTGITTAAGGSAAASGKSNSSHAVDGKAQAQSRISTAAGGSANAQGSGRGLSTAATVTTAAGAGAGGAASAGGGNGNAFGRGK